MLLDPFHRAVALLLGELWEALLFPGLASCWAKGLEILCKYLPELGWDKESSFVRRREFLNVKYWGAELLFLAKKDGAERFQMGSVTWDIQPWHLCDGLETLI